jgi:hypothetical protein
MAEYELDPRPFFTILHSLLRHDELDYDREAIGAYVAWVQTNATMLRKVCSDAEHAVLRTYYAFWDKHKDAPDREGMKPLKLPKQELESVPTKYCLTHAPRFFFAISTMRAPK